MSVPPEPHPDPTLEGDRPTRRKTRPRVVGPGRPPDPGEVLAMGRAARLVGVAPNTVMRWMERGYLKGYRLPGSTDRRVHATDLIDFALARGMFRGLAECVVAEGGILYRARIHERWGSPVARVAPRDAEPGAGVDWHPADGPRYTLKAASPEAYQVLVWAGFRFEDGR